MGDGGAVSMGAISSNLCGWTLLPGTRTMYSTAAYSTMHLFCLLLLLEKFIFRTDIGLVNMWNSLGHKAMAAVVQ